MANDDETTVVNFPGSTVVRLPAKTVLESAIESNMDDVLVIGDDADGNLYFSSTTGDVPTLLYLLEKCKQDLLEHS